MSTRSAILHFVTVGGLVFGLAGFLAGLVGDNWFREMRHEDIHTRHFGLLRMCHEIPSKNLISCDGRNVFSFNTEDVWNIGLEEKILDDIFAILLFSTIFGVLGLFVSLLMTCCFNKTLLQWRFVAAVNFLFISTSNCLGLAACGISESFILQKLDKSHFIYGQDWTSTVAWTSCAFLTISSLFAATLFCFTPFHDNSKQREFERSARRSREDNINIRFNFHLDKTHTTNWEIPVENYTRSNSTLRPLNVIGLDPTLDIMMCSMLDETIDDTTSYNFPLEYNSPPTYSEAVGFLQQEPEQE